MGEHNYKPPYKAKSEELQEEREDAAQALGFENTSNRKQRRANKAIKRNGTRK